MAWIWLTLAGLLEVVWASWAWLSSTNPGSCCESDPFSWSSPASPDWSWCLP